MVGGVIYFCLTITITSTSIIKMHGNYYRSGIKTITKVTGI